MFCAAFCLITLELNIRVSNDGEPRNSDIQKAYTYHLQTGLARAFIGQLKVAAAHINTSVGDTLFNIIQIGSDSALPHNVAKDHICTSQSEYQNKRN